MPVRIAEAASLRLDEIYRYTCDHWGEAQAERYISGLFDRFDQIETHGALSKPIPADFAVPGYFCRYQQHVIYWRRLAGDDIGIVTILHQRMHQIARFRDDFGT